jgi:VWFA-related protein
LKRRLLSVVVAGCASLTLYATHQSAASQSPQTPLFRGRVDIVSLDVSVFDKNHQPIKNLKATDFTVLEDGKPRPIPGFSEVNIPDPPEPTAPWMRDTTTDVATNDVLDRRLVMIVIDDASWGMPDCPKDRKAKVAFEILNGTGRDKAVPCAEVATGEQLNDRAKAIAHEVINRLTSVDLATIVFTGNNRAAQEFTTDHGRLLAGMDRVEPTLMDSRSGQDTLASNAEVETLRRAADMLISVPGRRKAFIDITRFHAVMGRQDRMEDQTRKIFEAAQHANVNVNIISLYNSGLDLTNWEEQWNQRVSHETAGQTIAGAPTMDMSAVRAGVTRIFQANSSYYLVGYSSADIQKFHTVKVTVNRPDADVLARDKYYWPEPDKPDKEPPPPIVKAITGILPDPTLPLRVAVAPFASSSKTGSSVAIALGVRPTADQPHLRASDDLQIRTAMFTSEGDARGVSTSTVHVALPPGASTDRGYDALVRVDLKPGDYELRLSAHSSVLGVDGGVYVTVEVPDFSALPVSMSGVVLSAPSAMPVAGKDTLDAIIPVTPTTVREFWKTDRASAFVRVYQSKSPPVPLSLKIAIVDAHDQHVLDRVETLAADKFGRNRGGDYQLDLPLSTLAPGDYLVTFDTAIGNKTAHRDVRFSVR